MNVIRFSESLWFRNITGMVLLIVKTIVVYPILLYCGRIVLEQLFHQRISNLSSLLSSKWPIFIRYTLATIWVISSAILAIYIPNIAVAINYLGSLANLFVFILPGLCLFLILFMDDEYRLLREELGDQFFTTKTILLSVSIFFISYGSGMFAYSFCLSLIE